MTTLVGCASRPVVLSSARVDALHRQEILPQRSCVLPRYELVDLRRHETMGWVGRGELRYPEIMKWLEASIAGAAEPDERAAPITIALSIAYMESQRYGHSFQLVLRARDASVAGNVPSYWRTYRGSVAHITWLGHDGELAGYVEQAGTLAIRQLVENEGHCASISG